MSKLNRYTNIYNTYTTYFSYDSVKITQWVNYVGPTNFTVDKKKTYTPGVNKKIGRWKGIWKMRVKIYYWFSVSIIFYIFFSKFKQLIWTTQHDFYIKMYLEIKFYIFFKIFYYILDRYKITAFGPSKNSNFVSI